MSEIGFSSYSCRCFCAMRCVSLVVDLKRKAFERVPARETEQQQLGSRGKFHILIDYY